MAAKPFDLRYVKTVGIHVNNVGRGFNKPYNLAVSREGRIYVLNRSFCRVVMCNLDEEYLGEFSNGMGSGDTQLSLPTGMAFDSQDRLCVTDEDNHRVSVFDSSGEFMFKWGEYGTGAGQLNAPSGIAFDSLGNAYVVEQQNNRVQKFTGDGEYLLSWGEFGGKDGQFNLPWGVDVDSHDNIYIADWRNDRVQAFTAEGEFVSTFGEAGDGDGQFHRPADVAVDGDGYIYVADWGNERVQVLGPDGRFLVKLRGQATESKWARDWLGANDLERNTRESSDLVPGLPPHLSTPYQVSSQTEPYFWGPVSVKLDEQGRLYVTECNRARFQVYERA